MRRIGFLLTGVLVLFFNVGDAQGAKSRRPPKPKPAKVATLPKLSAKAGSVRGAIRVVVTALIPGESGQRVHATCVARRVPPPPTSLHWDEFDTVEVINPDGTVTPTQLYRRTKEQITLGCGGSTYQATVCINGDCPEPPPPPPSGRDIALTLIRQLPLADPLPILSPSLDRPGASVIVGLPFYWAVDPQQWETIGLGGIGCSGTVCVSAEVTAVPSVLYFEPGDQPGRIETCTRPGTVVRTAREADVAGDDCSYVFQNRGRFDGAVGIRYEITWTSTDPNNPGGADAQDSERRIDLPVSEVQPVIVG